MNTVNKVVGWVALAIAIVALVIFAGHSSVRTGAITTTTNLPSIGTRSFVLGIGCDQNYNGSGSASPCLTGTVIDGSGNTNVGMSVNGIGISPVRSASVSGTTTPCAILSPSATSTLNSFTFMPTVGTSTSATVTLATSTTAFATTSSISSFVGYVPTVALTWEGGGNSTNIISPSTYVVAGFAAPTSVNGGFVMTGVCTATFQAMN